MPSPDRERKLHRQLEEPYVFDIAGIAFLLLSLAPHVAQDLGLIGGVPKESRCIFAVSLLSFLLRYLWPMVDQARQGRGDK